MAQETPPITLETEPSAPDRNLALELARVTEAAALAAGRWVGRGDKNGADGAAVSAMRQLISTGSMNGVVVIGEGEKDKAPMLFNGEQVRDGEVAGAILAAREGTGVDLLLGIGGTPEGIIAACAIKCLGGVMLGKLAPRDEQERQKAIAAGHDLDRVLTADDLVSSDDAFFAATGITDGDLLQGVRYRSAGGATTHSLLIRARSRTIRNIYSEHALWKVSRYSVVPY